MENELNQVKKHGKCVAIVLAAGAGKRMHTSVAKQFLILRDKPVICYSLDAFEQSRLVDEVILVTNPEGMETCNEIVKQYGYQKVSAVIPGGKERYHSVYHGLEAAAGDPGQESGQIGYVLIHDGARPFVTEEIIERNILALQTNPAVVTGMPTKDTVKIADEEGFVVSTPKRSLVWNIQTPQSFEYSLVTEAYRKLIRNEEDILAQGIQVTDDAMVVEFLTDTKVKLIEGSYENIKITTPDDLALSEGILTRRE